MSLFSILPAPKNSFSKIDSSTALTSTTTDLSKSSSYLAPPPYGKRKGWIPRVAKDFGDGGAFPEIHVVQYPLDMGRTKSENSNILPIQTDSEGKVKYDAIVKQGMGKHKSLVQTQFKDLVPSDVKDSTFMSRPSQEEISEVTEKTRLALEKITSGKIKAAQPKNAVQQQEDPTYIRYTSAQQTGESKARVIRMVEMPVDPFDPPKFKHKRVPKGPPSPPAPVLHSPPRKVTPEEVSNWNVPPCVSNWKNQKGYTIPLDKRLAADGRGLQEFHINDNFAKMAEALYLADRHARDEVRQRALMQQRVAQKEKEAKEEHLRLLAQKAREERSKISTGGGSSTTSAQKAKAELDEKYREREEIRREKQKERERELRMSNMGTETKMKMKARASGERDISEKIALGLAAPTNNGETMYDQRLFNQNEGVSTGFADDDVYNIYDKPLFQGSSASNIYRPKKNLDNEIYGGPTGEKEMERILKADRFDDDKQFGRRFQGTESGNATERDGPVQFEKDSSTFSSSKPSGKSSDPFGLDQFLKDAKHGKKRSRGGHEESDKRSKRD